MKTNVLPSTLFLFLLTSVIFALSSCRQNTIQDQKIKREKRHNGRLTDFLAAMEYEFNMQKNPKTGKIPEGIHEQELFQARQIMQKQLKVTDLNYYTFQGPDNLGGRTRTIVYDVRYNGVSNTTLFAGGVSGGIFKSIDNAATWTRKSSTGEHYGCTSIAQDTRAGYEDTWYYSTGENMGNSASGNSAFYGGNGIYKSVNNGETWTRLVNSNTSPLESFSTQADLINKVLVNPVNGDIYVACLSSILRSQDGGTTWSSVLNGTLSSSSQSTDIVVTSTGRLYAAFSGTNTSTVDGVWTSATGNSGSWTRIAGTGAASSPAGWNAQSNYGRVVLALAPANQNILYALYNNNASNPSIEAELYKYDFSTGLWVDRSANLPDEPGNSVGNDPFAVQGGYDLVISVKPDNENVVFIGGTNVYRSTDGFATSANTTRIGGYANASSYSMYANSHPDIHAIVFQPGSSSVMLCGNDGGIQRTSNAMAATVSWTPVNTGYRTFQYYYVAMDPRNGNNKVIGGAQDNGTTRNIGATGSNMEMVMSGDGVSVGLSNVISGNTYEYVGWQHGSIFRRNSTSASGFGTDIRPTSASANGLFVTLFYLDPDNTEYLYYANDNSLYKNSAASAATSSNWSNMNSIAATVGAANDITSLATTRGSYNASTSSLFMGTSNCKVYRLDDPINASSATSPVDISSGLPAAGYISSISVNPRNDDTVLVTLSNYGVNNIWWTGNANSSSPSWINVEGNLTLPSIRSSVMALTPEGIEYFVGTSVGLYKTMINSGSPASTSWTQEGPSEIGNAVVTSLAIRNSDNKLLVGTHGYGMWTATLSYIALPVTLGDFSGELINDKAILKWNAYHDQEQGGFDIEKSVDGINFRKTGFVPFVPNSSGLVDYSYTDTELWNGYNYYRLKIHELTGPAKISNIVKLRMDGKQNLFVTNPFLDKIEIRFASIPKSVRVMVTDASGKQVAQRNYNDLASTRISIDKLSALGTGVYFMRTVVDGTVFSHKLVRQ
jgi:hypothetical protein